MLTKISGTFVKIASRSDYQIQLQRGNAHRPAARFNKIGQDALYLSPDEDSARVAIGKYVQPGDPQRVLASYNISSCWLFDLRGADACDLYELARQPWRQALDAGYKPRSWEAADILREAGHVGLIDPSRQLIAPFTQRIFAKRNKHCQTSHPRS